MPHEDYDQDHDETDDELDAGEGYSIDDEDESLEDDWDPEGDDAEDADEGIQEGEADVTAEDDPTPGDGEAENVDDDASDHRGEEGENPCYPGDKTREDLGVDANAPSRPLSELLEAGDEAGPPTAEHLATAHGARQKVLELAGALGLRWIIWLLASGFFGLTVGALRALYEDEWGERFVFEAGNLYRYNSELGRYDLANEAFEKELVEKAEALAEECRQLRAATGNWSAKAAAVILKALPRVQGGEALVRACRASLMRLWQRDGERMNGDLWTLNLQNGLLDLRTQVLRPHTPDHLSTVQLPFPFIPGAECPTHLAYLGAALPDPPTWQVLQEYIGYLIVPTTKHERSLILTGKSGAGKSTLVKLIPKLLGEGNCSAVPLEELGDKFRVADLRDRLVNLVTEVDPDKAINDSRFKAFVSGDPQISEKKFKDPGMYRPFVRFVVACNDQPMFKDRTDAASRRLIIIRFEQKFVPVPNPDAETPELQADPDLLDKLTEELPGVLNWALEGLARLNERGHFDIPASLQANVQAFREDQNNALRFISEGCALGAGLEVSTTDLFRAYEAWCKTNGERPFPNNVFGRVVAQHPGVEALRSGTKGRYYKGLRPADGVGHGVGAVPATPDGPTPVNSRRGKRLA